MVLRTYVRLTFNSVALMETEGPSRLNCLSQRQGPLQPLQHLRAGWAESRLILAGFSPSTRKASSFYLILYQSVAADVLGCIQPVTRKVPKGRAGQESVEG